MIEIIDKSYDITLIGKIILYGIFYIDIVNKLRRNRKKKKRNLEDSENVKCYLSSIKYSFIFLFFWNFLRNQFQVFDLKVFKKNRRQKSKTL